MPLLLWLYYGYGDSEYGIQGLFVPGATQDNTSCICRGNQKGKCPAFQNRGTSLKKSRFIGNNGLSFISSSVLHDHSKRQRHARPGIAGIPEFGHSGNWLELLVEFAGRLVPLTR